ncbi:MAG: PH domain-containing protein [Anaerolineae bacterium]|jgi:hypothetical protein
MTKWEIRVARGFAVGIGLMSLITLVNAALIGVTASRPISLGTFIAGMGVLSGLVLVGLLAYWVYGLAGASYLLDRNALVIQWGPSEQVIPAGEIEQVLTGDQIEGEVRFHGGRWPGHWVGYGQIAGLGETLFYATAPLREQIFIATPGLVYSISPANRKAFLQSLHKRLQMGPTQIVEQSSRRLPLLDWPIWRDRLGLALLAVGALTLAGLIAVVCFRFPALPKMMPLHFGSSGSPDRLGARSELFLIPLIGALTLLTNGVLGSLLYPRDRVASYLLWGGTIVVQLLVWTATMGILARV